MICEIKYNKTRSDTHLSQVLAGFKLLENKKKLKLNIISNNYDFRKAGIYEHNSIVEVKINHSIIVYDMADGYQSIHRKDVFDKQLDRVTFYFKRSFDPNFHKNMKNKDKILPYGLNYYCTCKNNPYDWVEFDSMSFKELFSYWHGTKKWLKLCDYKNFESHNHYENYKILFLTRIWDSSELSIENISNIYPYFTKNESVEEYNKWKSSLDEATENRIKLIRKLRDEFGELFVGGIEDSKLARKICPELIVPNDVSNKRTYMKLLKNNFIGISSTGLHKSIGWKTAEYVSNSRAIISEPIHYVLPGDFSENKNYLKYQNIDECISQCYRLLNDINYIHEIEENNFLYYKDFVAPDKIIGNTLSYLDDFK